MQFIIRIFVLLFLASTACIDEYKSEKVLYLEYLPDSLKGLKMIRLLQGNLFLMGADTSEFLDEKPVHEVELSQFYMDETAVTYADFQKYVEAGGKPTAYHQYPSYNKLHYPVTGVSWHQAVDFCNWRSKVEGFEPVYQKTAKKDDWGFPIWEMNAKANGYRLPTEAEFEYAARSGFIQKKYPWGDVFDKNRTNYDTEKGQKIGERWRIVAVKSELPNEFGLYGMTGNIRHWCNDWYDSKAYQKLAKINPTGGNKPSTKVVRGGGWGAIHPKYLTVSKRDFSAPSNYNFDIGFRCVLPARAMVHRKDSIQKINLKVAHTFFDDSQDYPFEYVQKIPDFTDKDFIRRLGNYLADYFPNSIYFQQKIDKQEILKPEQLAELIVRVTSEYQINPLFLTGIIVSESGVGTCSFPRWFNNPSAFRWQNRLMKVGLPTYEDKPNIQNRKFHTLEDNFRAFCKGIRRELYYKAAKQNLYDFHRIYVGYEAKEWMITLSRVYRDVAKIKFQADFPYQDAGQLIYLDWHKINPNFTSIFIEEKREEEKNESNSESKVIPEKEPKNQEPVIESAVSDIPILKQKTGKFYLIYGSFAKKQKAIEYAQTSIYQAISSLKIIQADGRFRIAIAEFSTEKEAQKAIKNFAPQFKNVWVMKF